LGEDPVGAAAQGTRYYSGNSSVLQISADGKVTALADGETTITVVHESGEQVIPVRVVSPVVGTAVIGTDGGVVQGDGGQLVAFGRGQLPANTPVKVTTLQETELAAPPPVVMDFLAAFKLDLGGAEVANGPVQIAVNVPAAVAGETVYFLREFQTDLIDGVMRTYWVPVDTGIVGADGVARSTSPPWPGLTTGGNIMCARGNTPLRTISLETLLESYMVAAQVLALGAATGSLLGVMTAASIAGGLILFPIAYQSTEIALYTSWAGRLYPQVVPVDVGQTTTRIRVRVDTPPAVPMSAPVITGASFVAATGRVTVSGTGLFDANQPSATSRVVFRQGSREIKVNVTGTSGSPSLQVDVPQSVVLGLADIFIERGEQSLAANAGVAGATTKWTRSTASVRVDNPGGYGFVAQYGGVDVLDLQRKGEAGAERVIQRIPVLTEANVGGNLRLITRSVSAVVATSDLSRVFGLVNAETRVVDGISVTLSGGIVVIDGVTLRQVDIDPTTVKPEIVKVAFGASSTAPMALAVDPSGRWLYFAAAGTVYAVDIDPSAATPYRVKAIPLPTMDLPGYPGGRFTPRHINDMAFNSDGTRLYFTVPATEMYNDDPYLAWIRRTPAGGFSRFEGWVMVMNVDEADRPVATAVDPTPANPHQWQQVIATLRGGLEPHGIKATSQPDKMIFTSRLRGAINNPDLVPEFKGLQTITVTNNNPNGFEAKLKTTDVQKLRNSVSSRQLLGVKNPTDVAIMPDLSYAFVVDWWLPLSVGSDSPATLIDYEEKHKTGAKVTIIKDPFGPEPKQLASTTPIPFGFGGHLELSSDNKKLYASYRGAGDILVFDVQNLINRIAAIQALPDTDTYLAEGAGNLFLLERYPIDSLPPVPTSVVAAVAALPVNMPGIQVGPSARGLAVQPNDPLTLIAPIAAENVNSAGANLTFKWKIDESLLGTSNYTAKLFLSTLPPGQGLWPSDPPSDRTPLLEDAAPHPLGVGGGPDNNPNRLWTSPAMISGTNQIDLPYSPNLLTAGQRYYWGVRVFANGNEYTESASFIAQPQSAGTTYNGVTVLTHGFQLSPLGGDERFAAPEPFILLGRMIAEGSGGGVVLEYDKTTGEWVDRRTGKKGKDALQSGKAVVLVSDWKKESDISDSGFSEAAAEALYTSLKDLDNKTSGALFASKLHFIGHSRGTVVNSEIIQRLGTWDAGVNDIHMTTLDPHDFKQEALKVPVGTILGTIETALTLAQAAASAGSVAAPPLAAAIPPLQSIKTAIGRITGLASALGVALDIPYDDFLDPDVKRWTNVSFADNYYQTKGNGAVTYTAGPLSPVSPGSLTATPNGVSIDTANINRALDGLAGFTQDDFKGDIPLRRLGLPIPGTLGFELGLGGPHSRVWQWYAGTADTSLYSFAGAPLYRRAVDAGEIATTTGGLPSFRYNDRPWYWSVPGTVPGSDTSGNPWADPAAIWEGVTNGWYLSQVGGGLDARAALTPVNPDAEPLGNDNTEVSKGQVAVPNVFNGNFENGLRQSLWRRVFGGDTLRFPLSYELPGWSFHGGEGFFIDVPLVGRLDITGLFVFETNPVAAGLDVFNKLYDKVADKLIESLTKHVINK
ncbi:MAG: Ig-like domain-containing protein, partial [Burkholderiales bacterium]